MKIVLSLALAMSVGGCGTPLMSVGTISGAVLASLEETRRRCEIERQKLILRAWWCHETASHRLVVSPDWRLQARHWARIECEVGRPVASFHP